MKLCPHSVTFCLIPSQHRASLRVSCDGEAVVLMGGAVYRCASDCVNWTRVYQEAVLDQTRRSALGDMVLYFYWAVVLDATEAQVILEVRINEGVRTVVDSLASWHMKAHRVVFTRGLARALPPLPPSAPPLRPSESSCSGTGAAQNGGCASCW